MTNGTRLTADPKAAKAARLVWLLVLLGLGTGVFTLCVVRAALARMREQRAHVSAVRDAMDDVVAEVRRDCADARTSMEQVLSLQGSAIAAATTSPTTSPATGAAEQWPDR